MKIRGRMAIQLFLTVLLLIVFSLYVLAGDLLPLQGNVDSSGTPVSSGGLAVEIWDGPDVAGSNLVYNSTDNYTGSGNISSGKFDIVLGSVGDELNLEYGKVYYMDLFIAGNNMNFSGQERQVFMSSVGTINSSFLNTSNDYEFNSLLIDNKTAITTAYLNISDGATTKLIVDSVGNLGIGTTSPGATLEVVNNSAVSALFNITDGDDTRFVIDGAGKVGIGTTTPAYKLDVSGAIRATSGFLINYQQSYGTLDSGGSPRDLLQMSDDTKLQIGSAALAQDFAFQSTSGSVVTIKSTGNVGIGTTTPSMILDVNGDANITGTTYIGNSTLYVNESNVGIGTANPAYLLQVEGTTNTTGLRAEGLAHFLSNVTMDDNLTVGGNTLYVEPISGRIGIGGTNPAFPLDVFVQPTFRDTMFFGAGQEGKLYDSGAAIIFATNDVDRTLNLGANAGVSTPLDLVIATNHNIGIGTKTPGATLEVVNGSAVNALFNVTDGSDTRFLINGAGQVVIGTSEAPQNSSMIMTIAGGDLNVSGAVFSQGLVLTSPFVVKGAEGEPIPVCMKNIKGSWVGCMPDESNNWVCAHNKECDEKILGLETTWKLRSEGATDKEINQQIETVKQKFKQNKNLQTIKNEIKSEIGDMQVLGELDDTVVSSGVYGVQTQVSVDASNVNRDITALKEENGALRSELNALKEEVSGLKVLLNQSLITDEKQQPAGDEQLAEKPPEQPVVGGESFGITGASVWKILSNLF